MYSESVQQLVLTRMVAWPSDNQIMECDFGRDWLYGCYWLWWTKSEEEHEKYPPKGKNNLVEKKDSKTKTICNSETFYLTDNLGLT